MSKWGHLAILMCLILSTHLWASIGKVSLLKGEAVVLRENQTLKLITNSSIDKLDKIVTGDNSQIQLTFEDKTVITLGSSSVLDIQEYLNDAQQPKAKFKFNQGTFKSITGEIGKKAPENFQLETKTATIGIRGTTVAGDLGYISGESYMLLQPNPDGGTGRIVISNTNAHSQLNSLLSPPPPPPAKHETIGCIEGAIVVRTPQGSVDLAAGFATQIIQGQAPTPPAPLDAILLLSGRLSGGVLKQAMLSPLLSTAAPTIVEQASQTNQQATTLTHFTNQLDNYSDGFHPVFNPSLRATSKDDGIITLSGFTTSSYFTDNTTITSAEDTLTLNLNTSNDSITNSTITLLHVDPIIISLNKTADSSTMTYKDLNKFAIKNFNSQFGWMQTENTYANDYVSWGYWAMKMNDNSKLLPTTNYWVAGKDDAAANTHITSLIGNINTPITSYTYNGNVIGTVSNGSNSYSINPTINNAVRLNFDFGGGCGSLTNSSYIKFQTNQAIPQLWQITPSGSVTSGSFSINNTGNVIVYNAGNSNSYSTINGKFYGSSAQTVGGTFSAGSGLNQATGVFKAAK